MAAFPKSFLFALLLLVAMLLLSTGASAQSLNGTATNGTANATSPSNYSVPSATGSDEASAGTTISSSVALFGALIAAALFSL